MIYKPHNYQKYATEFIETHNESAVLLDMGLGKTSITLTAINDLLFDSFEVHKVLVIAPLRVARFSWKAEIEKWEHLHNLKYEIVVGTEKERIAALRNNADSYIINRDNVKWLVEKMGSKFNFDMVVIDELSSFKNYNSQRFRSFMKVRPRVKRMVGLTGTPSSNGLMDLFAEFKVLDMGKRLGRFIGEYRNNYFEPDKRNGQIIFSYKPLPNAEEQIYRQISDITISMKSTDYLEMPELIKSNYSVTLDDKEWNKYQELKEDLVLELPGGEITASNAAVLSNKLIQMANGAIYDENGEFVDVHSKKLEALEDLIESANGKPVLVAYWFKHDLERIEKHLKSKKIEFVRLDSDKSIEDWNNGKISVALIHPASTGHGLNLQDGGSTIIWFGLTWSLELYEQTNARLWRQGQKAKTVVIEHIVSKGTIDEQIIQALEGKHKVQDSLISAVKVNLSKSESIRG